MAKEKGAVKAKTEFPMTKAEFMAAEATKPITVSVSGMPVILSPKMFGTGSVGWHGQGKIVLDIDGTPTTFQVNFMLTGIGSKEAAEE